MLMPAAEVRAVMKNRLLSAIRVAMKRCEYRPRTRAELLAFGEATLAEVKAQAQRGEWSTLDVSDLDALTLASVEMHRGGVEVGFDWANTALARYFPKGGSSLP